MLSLSPDLLLPLNAFQDSFPIIIDVVYAKNNHPDNHFGQLYHPDAQIIWAHEDIVKIILLASKKINKTKGWGLKINDCLRPIEAQKKMNEYCFADVLVMAAGQGAHPRAMAIDIQPIDGNGHLVDMGTPFDFFADDPETYNPAARGVNDNDNRKVLDKAMLDAAAFFDLELELYKEEWWDFRFPKHIHDKYVPLSENDLLPYQRLIDPDVHEINKILEKKYPDQINKKIDEILGFIP